MQSTEVDIENEMLYLRFELIAVKLEVFEITRTVSSQVMLNLRQILNKLT